VRLLCKYCQIPTSVVTRKARSLVHISPHWQQMPKFNALSMLLVVRKVLSLSIISCSFHEEGTSSVLSITTHHHVFTEGGRSSVKHVHHNSFIMLCYTKGVVPPAMSQLITVSVTRKGSSLRAINHNSSCFRFKGTSLRAINHNSSSCCVFTKGTSLRAISQLIITLCFHERGTSLRAINHNSSSCCVSRKARPSVLSITTHHHVS
jgi:hypothetical protein